MECFQFSEAFHLPEFALRFEQPGRGPAQRLMAALAPHMDKTKFVRWMVKGFQLPPRWADALRRFFGIKSA
jgi:hypothetical protein